MKLIYLFMLFLLCSAAPQTVTANSVSIESIEYTDAWSPRVPKKVKKNKKKRKQRMRKIKKLQYFGEAAWVSIFVIFLMGLLALIFFNLLIMNIISAAIIGIALFVIMFDFITFSWEISKIFISLMFGIFDGIIALLLLILGLVFLNHIIWILGLVLLIVMTISLIIVSKY